LETLGGSLVLSGKSGIIITDEYELTKTYRALDNEMKYVTVSCQKSPISQFREHFNSNIQSLPEDGK